MTIVTLQEVLAALRIEAGVEDEHIECLIEDAEELVLCYLNRTPDELVDKYGRIPYGIRRAVCLAVGSLYKNREMDVVQQSSLNKLFIPLIVRYRKLV